MTYIEERVDLTHLFRGGFEDTPEIGQTKIIANVFDDDKSAIREEAVPDSTHSERCE